MIVGGYTVRLYCDAEKHEGYLSDYGCRVKVAPREFETVQNEFAGQNERECFAQARRVGWKLTRDRRTICPFCKESDR